MSNSDSGGGRKVPVSVEVPAELKEAFDRLADANERSTSAELRIAMREHLQRAAA